jgi:putative spermidine/putrescine transport system permease protein
VRTALVAGALLAFALSWDEIVVTYFTAGAQNTLPLLIFGKIRQGQELPIVNVIALVVIVVTVLPVFVAQRLTTGHDTERTTAEAADDAPPAQAS